MWLVFAIGSAVFAALTLILGNVFQQLYTMVDTMVVGRFVSKSALAAVGATGAILFLIISSITNIVSI